MRLAVEDLNTCLHPFCIVEIAAFVLGKDETEAALVKEGFPICSDGGAGAAEGGEGNGAGAKGSGCCDVCGGFAPEVGGWGCFQGEALGQGRGRGLR